MIITFFPISLRYSHEKFENFPCDPHEICTWPQAATAPSTFEQRQAENFDSQASKIQIACVSGC